MIKKMYSLLDEKSKLYSQPFYAHHDGEALRSFASVVSDKETMPGKFPADFTLWKVGEWDDNSGIIDSKKPVYLAKAVDFCTVDKKG